MQLEDLVSLCKQRGFVYQSSMIYGGLQGFFDYGPLGVELKNNIKNAWWKNIVYLRENVYGLDSAVILNKAVVNYSGHLDTFHDMLIDCKVCKARFRDNEVVDKKCPKCGSVDLSLMREFNLMMHVNLGPTQGVQAVLRPETAQSVFINFKNICDSFSPKLPFGIAQVGKAFRNEITPKNFIFRMREFEQMELEYFIRTQDEEHWFNYWLQERVNWWKKIGVTNIKLVQQNENELAHYSNATTDIVFEFPHGWEEIEGVCNRGDFDLASHTKMQDEFDIKSKVKENKESIEKLCIEDGGKQIVPSIVEVSAGLDRAFLAVLTSAYCKEELPDGQFRTVLKFLPTIAPIKVAIIPLARNKAQLAHLANEIFHMLKEDDVFPVILETGGNIGKAYRKHDEIGTPYCITIDFESIEKKDVTIRYRDSMRQERIQISELTAFIKQIMKNSHVI